MQPIDYTRGFQPVNIADNIAGGFDVGSGIRAELQRRRDDMIARQQAEQKQIAAMKRTAEYERDLFGVFNDPSPQNLARLQLQYPERVKEFQSGFDTLDKARVADEKRFIGEVYAASRSNPEVAKKLLSDRVAALENAREDATEEKTALDMLDSNPKQALGYIGSLAAFTLDKDQIEALTKLSGEERAEALAPATQAKAEADAALAVTTAQNAPQRFAFDMAKVQEDIRASRENTRLRAIESQLKREENVSKRDELALKAQEARAAFSEKVQAREADLNSALSSTDNFLNTASRALEVFTADPGAVRNATGTIQGRLPTIGQDTADFEGLIENLKSQAFLAQIPNIKGMGALSNAEGEKLQNALQNFDLKQSPERLKQNLQEASRLIAKARQNIVKRYGAEDRAPAPDIQGSPRAPASGPAAGTTIVVDF